MKGWCVSLREKQQTVQGSALYGWGQTKAAEQKHTEEEQELHCLCC